MASSKKPARRQTATPAKKPTRSTRTETTEPNIARLEKLVRILERSSLSELEYEDKDIVVRLSRATQSAPVAVRPAAPAPAPAPVASAPAAAPAEATDDDHFVVKSPFVGTFYRAPSPEDSAFVEVGSEVAKGQTLCIIEAMKLMNEIESEVSGTIQEVLAENGKAVQFGEPLFRVAKK